MANELYEQDSILIDCRFDVGQFSFLMDDFLVNYVYQNELDNENTLTFYIIAVCRPFPCFLQGE